MHKLQDMIIGCPWIDHHGFCSIPTLWWQLEPTDSDVKALESSLQSFSAQFLTWSFSAPISCLVLNGFHSCFLKPKSLAGVACYRSPYKVKSVRESGESGDTEDSQWFLHSTMNQHWRKGEEKFHELHKGFWCADSLMITSPSCSTVCTFIRS